eukprot:7213179-Heterocapsa_arctica.AAC.1
MPAVGDLYRRVPTQPFLTLKRSLFCHYPYEGSLRSCTALGQSSHTLQHLTANKCHGNAH